MYRIELLSQKELTELLRRGIRTRTLTITTTDGSNIRLMPNRPVIVSDETIKMNPSILTDPTVKARHIPDKKIVDTIIQEEFATIELPVDLEVRKVQPAVEEVREEISDADIEALLLTPSSNSIEESADEAADAPQQKQVSAKRKRK